MGITRKDYVVQVVNQLAENPRGTLAGHGLAGPILGMIATRPDIMGKLAVFAYSSVNYKKGAKALKKAANFKISGYKTFAEFNSKAREDVETFMSGLPEKDAESFSNENNILTFIILPDKETGNTETDIANLKSVVVPFNSSVKKEYKISGGIYVTIMWGDSILLPRDVSRAEVKKVVNKRIISRKTPAKVKAELTSKAKAKLTRLKIDAGKLKANANKTAAELQQFNSIGKQLGVQNAEKPNAVLDAMKSFTTETKAFLRGLPPEDKKLYMDAVKYKKAGKLNLMYNLLAEVSPENSEKITSIVRGGNITKTDDILAARRKQFRAKISEITAKNEELLVAASEAPTAKLRANINFKIRANIEQIKLIKAKINLHKDMKVSVIKNKAKLLASTNAAIQANKASGMSIQEALNSAIAELPINVQQKQQIKQQVIQQLTTGTPLEYAVQQSIQNLPSDIDAQVTDINDELGYEEDTLVDDVFGNMDDETADIASQLAGSKTIKDILSIL